MSAGTHNGTDGSTPLLLGVTTGGLSLVNLDGRTRSQAFNPNTISAWSWKLDGKPFSTASNFQTTLGIGSHPIELVVTDVRNVPSAPASGTIVVSPVLDIGSLGGASTTAFAINKHGDVAGTSLTGTYGGGGGVCGFNQCPIGHAFIWKNGFMTDIGSVFSGIDSTVYSLNGSGEAVGFYIYPGYFTGGFLFDGARSTDLGSGRAWDINEAGQVVGGNGHPYSLQAGVTTDLGTLGGTSGAAFAINSLGEIAGYTTLSGEAAHHAFLYVHGQMADLGTLGGTNSIAWGLNDSRQIVGVASLVGDAASHAFRWDRGSMTDLGTLGGVGSQANRINNLGQVVGWANIASGEQHAFVWSGGTMTDLNSVFSVGPGVWLVEATSINDAGQIVANGSNGHAYLLPPY